MNSRGVIDVKEKDNKKKEEEKKLETEKKTTTDPFFYFSLFAFTYHCVALLFA